MEWLLIGLILLAIAVNIRSFMVLKQFQSQRKTMLEDAEVVKSSMEEFVENIELENDGLYNRLVEHIAQKEQLTLERLRELEQKIAEGPAALTPEPASAPAVKKPKSAKQKAVAKTPEPVVDPALPENEKIEQLHKQGFSTAQIAKVVAAERGEIELVVNMFKKKQSYQK